LRRRDPFGQSPSNQTIHLTDDIQRKENQPMIEVGQKAPDFALKDQFGREVKSADFLGKCNVMLLFYPLDWTPT
jgi:cytochrome oxidase Cu insertion factor (SCO1/SenC/PrrC family)